MNESSGFKAVFVGVGQETLERWIPAFKETFSDKGAFEPDLAETGEEAISRAALAGASLVVVAVAQVLSIIGEAKRLTIKGRFVVVSDDSAESLQTAKYCVDIVGGKLFCWHTGVSTPQELAQAARLHLTRIQRQ